MSTIGVAGIDSVVALGFLRDLDAGHHLCPDNQFGATTWNAWLLASMVPDGREEDS